ncbi:hypothetical protein P168DRAFT_329249 [Aspergillus campestris IBT 28561]|uniref:Uncharacterized protein n=1 Tax=Aspergillus campestris (strain IBT 28561) TaxID=1392248 RepID=A0A2I1CXF2_ASPC2|nr:uncharacterized protein P168DRAFT_329249 [Aspergillus campestris IBT 28561]PKY02304.1 hypothetical protein P168DRAFT_329249 [Aspergillus campestris IBT 28561]
MPPCRTCTPLSGADQSQPSMNTNTSLPAFTDPPGWTSHPPSPTLYHEEWIGPNSNGQVIAESYDLEPGQPVIEDTEGWHTIFNSGDKFYLWGRLGDEVEEFVEGDILVIVEAIRRDGLRGLERRGLG